MEFLSFNYLFCLDKASTLRMASCKFLFEMYSLSDNSCSDYVFNVCEVGMLMYYLQCILY